jgi:hypothetical protein
VVVGRLWNFAGLDFCQGQGNGLSDMWDSLLVVCDDDVLRMFQPDSTHVAIDAGELQ